MVTGTELADLAADERPAEDSGTPSPEAVSPAAPRPWWRDPASWAVLAALIVWALPVTHGAGGRDPYSVTYGLLALTPALVLTRPWRALGRRDLVALLPVPAALFACFVAPTGMDGLRTLAAFAYAGLFFVALRGYLVRDAAVAARARVAVVVAGLVVAGVDQFLTAWWAWYGRQDTGSLFVGSFFWHNQFVVFMAALGLFGGVLAVRGSGRVRWVGGVLAVVAIPSLAFGASRASLGLFVVGWLLLAAVSVRNPRRLITWVAVPVVGVVLALFLASPLMMDESKSIASNVEQRESATATGSARIAYDRIAIRLTAEHPLAGTGTGSFGQASAPLLPDSLAQPTSYVHNGFLQAFVDGGVPLGLTVLVAALAPIVVGLRRAWRRRLARRGDTFDAVSLGALGALGLLAVHSFVDFDWTYPSLLALYAIFAAVLMRTTADTDDTDTETDTDDVPADSAPQARRVTVVLVVVAIVGTLLVALPASVRASSVAESRVDPPVWAPVVGLGVPRGGAGPDWLLGATECTNNLMLALGSPSTDGMADDVACLSDAGEVAPSTEMLRARGITRLGDVATGQAIADRLAARYGSRIPQLVVAAAALPADAGDVPAARKAVRATLTDPRVSGDPSAVAYAQAVLTALGDPVAPAAEGG